MKANVILCRKSELKNVERKEPGSLKETLLQMCHHLL
jgi:hypothetical protein